VSVPALSAVGGVMLVLISANRLQVRRHLAYAVLGVALWIAVLLSGVHATIAGVLLAFTVPATTRIDGGGFVRRAEALVDSFAAADHPDDVRRSDARQAALSELEDAIEAVQTPLQRLEHSLHPWVAYGIVPLFALANAGVSLGAGIGAALASPVAYGVIVGLVVGKQVGVVGTAWAVVRLGWAELPAGVTWRHMWGAGWVAGIGFTMSLFISELAFSGAPGLLDVAKVAILTASVIAAAGGWLVLRGAPER
jgi:Na+:H+ antiporter, NhaA family